MSYAYMALYTGDYLRDTRHLTPQKHGIYLLLLMHCWDSRGPVPLDEQECAGIANCRSADEVESLRYVLERYFVRCEDGWYNERMAREIEKSAALSKVWIEAGKRGAQARLILRQAKAKPRLRVGQAEAATPPPPPPLTPTSKEEPVVCIVLNDGSEYQVFNGLLARLDALYPGVDPVGTLKQIAGWADGNPTRRKTRSGILRHIHAWFAKEQNRVS